MGVLMFHATSHSTFPMPESHNPVIPARRAPKAKRKTNWRSASTPKTIALQARIRWILEHSDDGLTVRELAAELGMSRQLCLYHVKKMAATAQCIMMLEPCLESGGLRFRCWNEMQMIVNYRMAA